MRSARWAAPLLLLCSMRASGAEPPPSSSEAVPVEKAVAVALERNLTIKSAQADVRAAQARRQGAGLLFQTNPEVSFGGGPRRRAGESATTDLEIGLDQTIPIAGQRGLRITVTDAAVKAAEARMALQRLEVASAVRQAYARALAAEARTALAEQADRLSREVLAAAEERFKEGASSRIEVNTARVDRGRALRDVVGSRSQRVAARSALAIVVGDPGAAAWALVEPKRDRLVDVSDTEAYVSSAVERHPAVVAARLDVTSTRAESTLAGREAVPDIRVGAAFAREERANIVLGRIGVGLPLFNRRQAERGVANARRDQFEQLLIATEREVAIAVRTAVLRLRAAEEIAGAFTGGVLGAMDENLTLISEGYRAGKLDLFQLLVIRRDTLDARRGYIDNLEELQVAEAEVARVAGVAP